jgi:CRISPR/Cas system-associated protein Cas10 (large subunit of type III CRISPR-Cas system)
MKSFKEHSEVNEVMSRQARIKRSQAMKRMSKKIAMKKKIAAKKKASPEKLKLRARKLARKVLVNKLTKGRPYQGLSIAEKEKIEQKLKTKSAVIDRIAKKLLPKVKEAEVDRLKRVRGSDVGE